MLTRHLQKQIDRLWTLDEVQRRVRVSHTTLHKWRTIGRMGPEKKRTKLQSINVKGEERPTIRFVPEDVVAFCNYHGIQINTGKEVPNGTVAVAGKA